MQLQELYNRMLSEGFNRFYIDGVGGPISDDVECLGKLGDEWCVYYVERAQKSEPIFASPSMEEAIEFYYDLVSKIDHWHLIAFTRFETILESAKRKLESNNVHVIQNDIPHYAKKDDRIYRLFVVNKDVFKAKELFIEIPIYDQDLKR